MQNALTHRLWFIQTILLLGTVAGSSALVFGRLAQREHIPTDYLVAFRLAIGSLVLLPIILHSYRQQLRKLSCRGWLFGIIGGFWMAASFSAGFASIEHTSILVNNMLGASSPLWIALIEVGFLKIKLKRTVWIGLAVTLAGAAAVALGSGRDVSAGDNPGLGLSLALIATITSAFYTIFGRQSREEMDFIPYLWLVYKSSAAFAGALVIVRGTALVGYSAVGYGYLLLITLLAQLAGHITFNFALRYLPATNVSLTGQLGPVLSAILAFLIFHETPGALQIPASAAILFGITLVNLGQVRAPH